MAENDLYLVEMQFQHPYCEECGKLKDECKCEDEGGEVMAYKGVLGYSVSEWEKMETDGERLDFAIKMKWLRRSRQAIDKARKRK